MKYYELNVSLGELNEVEILSQTEKKVHIYGGMRNKISEYRCYFATKQAAIDYYNAEKQADILQLQNQIAYINEKITKFNGKYR